MEHYEMKKIRKMYFCGKHIGVMMRETGKTGRELTDFFLSRKYEAKRDRYLSWLIHRAYRSGKTLQDVSDISGAAVTFLGKIKRKCGIRTKRVVPNKRMTKEIEDAMISAYLEGKSTSEVAKSFGFKTSKSAEDVLHKYDIQIREPRLRRQLDYSYLKKIDTHDKAYILGLLYTDGYVYKDYEGICIQLTESDGYLLEKVAEKFGLDACVIRVKCDTKRKAMPNCKDMVRLGVYSKELAEQARELGVVKRKTYCLKMTDKVPDKFIYSFMRGVIDGDGCVYYHNEAKSIGCNFSTMSSSFAEGVCNLSAIKEPLKIYRNKIGFCHVQVMGGSESVLRFMGKMYAEKGDLYLRRKYEKMQDFVSAQARRAKDIQP